jgi:hypothetical protein
MCERFLWLFRELTHTQNSVVYESADGAHGMNGASKMSAMVHKRISATARV